MASVMSGLTVNGMGGYQLSVGNEVALLESGGSRLSIPLRNINMVAFQQTRNPLFLWLAVILFVFAFLATSDPRPAIGEYEIVDWYWWVLASAIATGLYFAVQRAAVVVSSGSTRTILRGSPGTMRAASDALQPFR
ncbi:hypothetical protein [Deinococcus humi]|uniref:Uncharacterized protein n=1 Tax=Deinococcus humi TaxID=662880 RepID=A0A7W8JRZ1_9DEIO|nr:hypothetical protein [Deinococcus humi]MBB5362091.1 hypothetical protein [Deinococcus humi]